MKKLNNKGYMLVEIILAVSLAMGVGYFLIELTLKLKNANEDLLVESLVRTDQGIIYNMIMEDVYNSSGITVNDVKANLKVDVDKNRVTYKDEVLIVNEYAKIENVDYGTNKITIPITVKQLPEENFNVEIYFAS